VNSFAAHFTKKEKDREGVGLREKLCGGERRCGAEGENVAEGEGVGQREKARDCGEGVGLSC